MKNCAWQSKSYTRNVKKQLALKDAFEFERMLNADDSYKLGVKQVQKLIHPDTAALRLL